jgi:predicted nucleic acid-binding protein
LPVGQNQLLRFKQINLSCKILPHADRPLDYLIAAQARRRGTTLVTVNFRDFARVPGLLVADWMA